MSRKMSETRPGGRAELRSLVGLLPLIVGSVLIAFVATAAVPASTYCSFQSPVSPVATSPLQSPTVPEATATGPALVAVPVAPNFLPWIVGLVVTAIVVGLVLYWRGRREGGEGTP